MKQVQNFLKYLCIFFLFPLSLLASNEEDVTYTLSGGEITGKIIDKETQEAIPFATIQLLNNGTTTNFIESDDNGLYTIKPIPAGKYTMKISYIGYLAFEMIDILVQDNRTIVLNIEMEQNNNLSGPEIVVTTARTYEIPLIDIGNAEVGMGLSSQDLEKMPIRKPSDMATLATGVIQNEVGQIQIRGGRAGTTLYLVDGMRVNSINGIPAIAIDQMQVITGGIPAKYGDATGGVVVITTKGYRSQ